jgi:hypothetical protein
MFSNFATRSIGAAALVGGVAVVSILLYYY